MSNLNLVESRISSAGSVMSPWFLNAWRALKRTLKEVIAVSRTWKLIAGLKLEDFRRAYEELHALFAVSKPAYEDLKNSIFDSLTAG